MILGLLMTLLIPAIGAGGGRSLRKQGDKIAATLELARQRAVVTGKPHRVAFDLERGRFAVEWLVSESQALGGQDEDLAAEAEGLGDGVIDLAPPLEDERSYYPIPNKFGAMEPLERGYFFEGLETPDGWIESGEAFVVFEWDGSTDVTRILVSDQDNRTLNLEVAPLLETVRIHEEVD